MKHLLFSTIIFLFFANAGLAQHNLKVNISQFKNHDGKVYVALYNSEADFLSETELYRKHIGPVTGDKMTITFDDLPDGNYALSVFHDANGNDELDTNFFGAPKESYGFSNNPKIWLRAPTFAEARIGIAHDTQITIRLKG